MSFSRFCLPASLVLSVCGAHAQNAAPSTVVVAGKRADVINKIDRKVYRADADIQASTGSAADLLNNIPAMPFHAMRGRKDRQAPGNERADGAH